MLWFLLWAVLVLGAAAVFFLLGRDLWRKSRLLLRELGAATDRLSALGDRLAELEDARQHPGNGPGVDARDVRSQGSDPRQQR